MRAHVARYLFWGVSLVVIALIALPGAEGQRRWISNLIWYSGWVCMTLGIVIILAAMASLFLKDEDSHN